MAKQLNVNLAFTANTSEAKRQLQDLQHQLNQLANTPVSLKGKGITKEIIEASNAAAELKVHLDKATNVQTGNLDFTKLSQSIKNSGSSLAEYGEKLKSLGPAGNTAFQALAQSVAKAEIPIRRSNAALTEMWTTLKNTARWQVSSSILHGFMGAVQSAYGYAQDLNSSLNNIRIVTGQNTEQMARFAEEANKAARALSATTTDYTNASLIYYQQGLSDSEVAQRTEVTIKMANAAGVSAEKVSDQLTAVWNNFYDGSKSLEYYADVMTALGAATASSTDEISDGLNKFAAVAETVGLSYEYATSALATVTATTRESADVVGTAFKTLFARIQGLTLGETLEDGTDLNKYSEALYKVGIDIKDTNGNMKDMDAILNELGAKWQTLGKDQQTALAQTVAGVRQYTQLVALMDNWDYFQENLGVATGATGALQEQADIYAESWEAAQKRVTAAAEAIYSDLLNDDFFIDVLNGFEKFLGLIDHLLDSMGGVQGALAGISALVLKLFSNQISQGITNMAYNMKMMTESGRQAVQDEQKAFITDAADSLNPSMDSTIEGQARSESLKTQLGLQVSMIENIDKMSEAEKEVNSMYMDRLRMLGEEVALRAKTVDEAKEKTSEASLNVRAQALETTRMWTTDEDTEGRKKAIQETNDAVNRANKRTKRNIGVENIIANSSDKIRKDGKVTEETLNKITKAMEILKKKGSTAFDDILKDMPQVGDSAEIVEDKLRQIEKAARDAVDELATQDYADAGVLRAPEGEADAIQNLTEAYREEIRVSNEAKEAKKAEADLAEDLENKILNAEGSQKKWSDTLVASAQSVSTMVMGLSSLGAAWDALTNPDLSGWEKFVSVSTSLAMGLPAVISGMTGLNNVLNLTNAARMVSIMRLGEESKAQAANTLAKVLGISTETALAVVTEALTLGKGKLTLANLMEAASNNGVTISKGLETAATIAQTVANWGLLASMPPLLAIMLVLVAVIGGLALIIWGIVSAANALSDAYNADAIAAENAEKGAKNLADAYNGVKQEYEDMIASMENYKSARDALDNLTEGTKEYDAALKEANRAAMELVNQYGLIEGQDYEWQGDELVVKDEAMDRVSAAKEAEADEAYAASQMANANAKALRAQSNLTDARREIRDDNGLGDGDLIWQSIGAGLVNTIVPGVGNLIMANQMSESAEMDAAIQRAVEEAKDNQNLFDTKEAMAEALDINLNDTDLVDALWANQEEIQSLANEMNAAEAAWKMATQNSANEILNNNEVVQNSENAEDIMAAGGNMYSVAYEDAYDKYLADAKDRGLFNTGTDASKKAFEDYAEKAGLNDLKNFKVTNYKGDGTVEYKYVDDQGQEQKVIATAEEIAATLAAAEAAEKLGASAENLVRVFNDLDASGKAYDQAMKDFLSAGDFENATKEEATALTSLVDTGGDGAVNATEASAYLGTEFGGEDKVLSDEEAKQYGYESAQAMINAFTEELNNIDEAWESIELPSELKGLDDMSLKTAQAFENTVKDLNLGPAGEEAGAQYIEGINKMVEGLSEEDQTKALEQLATIDWSNWDALEQADAIMKEFGVDIDTTSDEWIRYAENMRLASGATPDFSELRDTLTSITSILQDLDFGSIISDEDYQKLVEYNDEWERFFLLQADGSRMFIGDTAQMQAATRENIRQQREELAERKRIQEDFKNVGWGHNDENGNRVAADWKNKSGSDTGTAKNLMDATGATQEALNALGYTDQIIQDMITKATSGQADLVAEGEAQLREMYQRIGEFQEEEMDEMDADFAEMIASTATNMNQLNEMLSSGEITSEAWEKQAAYLETTAARNATTLQELDSVINDFNLNKLDESYTQNLVRIAEGYESCADELADYNAALAAFTLDKSNKELEQQLVLAEDNLRAMIRLEEGAKQYDLEIKSLTAQSKRLAKAYGISAEEAANLAIKNQRMNKGVSSLVDNWKDWKKQLNSSNKLTQDYADAVVDCTSAIADLVGASEDLELPDEFFNADNMALIEKALTGDVDAINKLGAEVAATTVEALEFNGAFAELINELEVWDGEVIDITLNDEQFAADKELVLQGINDIKNGVITADQAMSDDWVAALNRMALATGMSVEEMNGLLGSLGVQAQVDTTYVEQPMTVPTYRDEITSINYRRLPVTKIEPITGIQYQGWDVVPEYTKASVPGKPLETTGFAAVAQISTVDNPLTAKVTSSKATTGSPAASYSGKRGSVAPSATKGSGSSGGGNSQPKAPDKAEKRDKTKKSEIAERYRQVEDAIDNVTDALTRAERASERLWGKDKLRSMREENKILKQQYDLLQEKADQARKYAEEDYAALMKTAGEVGINLSVDKKTGDITNIEDAMETLYNRLSVAEEEYNKRVEEYNKRVEAAGSNPSQAEVDTLEAMEEALEAYEKDVIGKIEDDIAAVQDAEKTFQDSVEIWEEAGLDMEEILDQIMQNNYDIIMQGLEIPLSLNEEDLRLVDLKLSKLEDNVYQMAEALSLTMGKVDEYKDNLQLADEALAELNRAHEAGEITDAAYQEGLQEIKDTYYDNVEALLELDNLMKNYYGETLDAANEELSKYTEQMEHQTSVLEHYNNLISLMGKSNDYKMIGKVLEGQVETTKNSAEVSKNWYEARRADADALAQQYQDALNSGASAEELEILKNNWQAAEQAANEAQEQMLSDAEAWAEALKALLENKLSELGQALENALTGDWGSFDAMTTALERANSLQEEYLTTTNQVYETNKLMRTAQQAIDATTNSVAKKKLAAYIEETKQLQDQSKLSSYELEIQQAKYDLLLAEIALEEAQDAKSTVRLQRDSEGNFGYVYTADSNKINEAQQQLEDAQNRLYNIGLEGANSYTEKYQQTMAEMYDTLNQIQQDYLTGSFESEEEYQAAMQAAKEYYYQKLQDYSSLYSVALTTDSRVVADAWSTDFSSMIYDTEVWMDAVNDYTNGAIGAFREWQNAVTGDGGVTEIIGSSLEEVAGNVNEVANKSKDLADTTNKEVIPALNAEITSVENLTGAYAAMRDTIKETIEYYEKMISDINNAQNNEWNNGDSGEDDDDAPENTGTGSNTGNTEESEEGEVIPGTNANPNITGEGEGNPALPSYKKGTLSWTGNGSGRVWTDSAGKTYSASSSEGKAIQAAFNRAYSKNGGYKGDYFLGWNQLDADVLHKKYGLSTGGYTGDWSGSYGKLAFLHQKELVLNAQDTQNFLESMNVLDKIISAIDLYSMNSQLGGILSSPVLGKVRSDMLEQQVHIEASFPGVQDRNEIEEAFNNLINQASQYANRK